MRKRTIATLTTLAVLLPLRAQAPAHEPFRWGAASAAYQVEGAATADNKGPSIWDVYLDQDHLGGPASPAASPSTSTIARNTSRTSRS